MGDSALTATAAVKSYNRVRVGVRVSPIIPRHYINAFTSAALLLPWDCSFTETFPMSAPYLLHAVSVLTGQRGVCAFRDHWRTMQTPTFPDYVPNTRKNDDGVKIVCMIVTQ